MEISAGEEALEYCKIHLTGDSCWSSEDQKANKKADGKDQAQEASGTRIPLAVGLQATCCYA